MSVRSRATINRPGADAVRGNRTFNTRLIRRDHSFDTREIVDLLKVHENTVANWRQQGLKVIDDKRPVYVHGSDLIEFLARRQAKRRRPCGADEFFCCKCRAPRKPWERAVDVEIRDERRLVLKAVCEDCGTAVNKIGSVKKLASFRALFDFQTVTDLRLKG